MSEPNERSFPPIPERPILPFVKAMDAAERREYEAIVKERIDDDVERIIDIFTSVEDFDDVSREAIGYISLRLATGLQSRFDEGLQEGLRLETPSQRWNAMLARRVSGNPMG